MNTVSQQTVNSDITQKQSDTSLMVPLDYTHTGQNPKPMYLHPSEVLPSMVSSQNEEKPKQDFPVSSITSAVSDDTS